jgi:hypothetical protein
MLARLPRAVITVCVMTAAFPQLCNAQSGTKIIGCAIDDLFGVLPGMGITLTGEGVHRSVTTTAEGCYELTNVQRGTYTLSVHDLVFMSDERQVTVSDDPTLIFDFIIRLKPTAIREPPLTVIGGPRNDTNAASYISGCVTDDGGRPQPGMTVEIEGTATIQATTDENGCFTAVVAPGSYRLPTQSKREARVAVAPGARLRCPTLIIGRR